MGWSRSRCLHRGETCVGSIEDLLPQEIRFLQKQYPVRIFCGAFSLQNMLGQASIPAAKPPRLCFESTYEKYPCGGYFSYVLSTGIEPILQAPQACVLSVERREQSAVFLQHSKHTAKTLKIPVLAVPETPQDALRGGVLQGCIQCLQRRRRVQG